MRAISSVMMSCSLRVALIPPYCLGPVRGDPAFARKRVIPWHQFRRRRARRATPKREGKIGFQPCPYVLAELGFGGGVTTEHGEEVFDADAGERIARGMPPSFHFDVGGAYDGGPRRELVREQLAEFGGRADLDLGAEGRESRARLRLGKAIAERSIELVDDGGGRSGRSHHAQPERRL